MKKILWLGSTGFISQNILSFFKEKYCVDSPKREQLDLTDSDEVKQYIEKGNYDVIINTATPTGQSGKDKSDDIFELSLRAFMSLANCYDLYGKMIYIGSGAEYGKHRAIQNIKEEEFGCVLPKDSYGLARFIMSELSTNSANSDNSAKYNNIYNLRLFGCYGNTDPPFKLIPSILQNIKDGVKITLRQNVFFDFLYVKDIIPVFDYFINNTPQHNFYNLTSGKSILIGDIAFEICKQLGSDLPIVFQKDGLALEYTGNNDRLRTEIPNWTPTSIEKGIMEILKNENIKF
ncbi:hypothetical protein FACS1894132_07530 [Clostridia bacterium]|nr:hypothetical protein FACS1894132_07530 [Clostridia bacterium]